MGECPDCEWNVHQGHAPECSHSKTGGLGAAMITVSLDVDEWVKVVVALDLLALRGERAYKLVADKVNDQVEAAHRSKDAEQ